MPGHARSILHLLRRPTAQKRARETGSVISQAGLLFFAFQRKVELFIHSGTTICVKRHDVPGVA